MDGRGPGHVPGSDPGFTEVRCRSCHTPRSGASRFFVL